MKASKSLLIRLAGAAFLFTNRDRHVLLMLLAEDDTGERMFGDTQAGSAVASMTRDKHSSVKAEDDDGGWKFGGTTNRFSSFVHEPRQAFVVDVVGRRC